MIIVDLGDGGELYSVDWSRLAVWYPMAEYDTTKDLRDFTASKFLASVEKERAHAAMKVRMRQFMQNQGAAIVRSSFEERWAELGH